MFKENRMKRTVAALIAALLLVGGLPLVFAEEEASGPVIFDMDTIRHKADEKAPAAKIELVDGKFGKACQFAFAKGEGNQILTGFTSAKDFDQYEGFSFWLKGDGSDAWISFELIDSKNYALRYAYAFPAKSTEWKKIMVAWKDVVPEIAGPLMGVKDGFNPSSIDPWWIGRWGPYWRPRDAGTFTIDQVCLEKKIPQDTTDYTPKDAPLAKLVAKLKAKKPITFVSMGDSLTDKAHNSNANAQTWAELLAKKIKDTYGSEVTYINPALGGTQLNQNLVVMGKWEAQAPSPDLVTVFFGGNDYGNFTAQKTSDGDMTQFFGQWQAQNIDRLRRQTKGSPDIILMTTAPGFKAWDTYKPLIDATKAVAKDKKTALCDIDALFHAAGTAEDVLKAKYWHWDNVHMGPKGHEAICEAMMKLIEGEKK
jgi:lysophospholipase L1-like esterase